MNSDYQSAKQIALGLEDVQFVQSGEDLWNVSLGDHFSGRREMPYQFFEHSFEPDSEQLAHKAALMLYDEYSADIKEAEYNFNLLLQILRDEDTTALQSLMNASNLEEWMSLIFLDGDIIQKELVPLLENADRECRTVFLGAVDRALDKLVGFTDLMNALKECCRG